MCYENRTSSKAIDSPSLKRSPIGDFSLSDRTSCGPAVVIVSRSIGGKRRVQEELDALHRGWKPRAARILFTGRSDAPDGRGHHAAGPARDLAW